MTTINISKLDAAKRQLDMAIRLFMNNEDPVSTHTLTAASHQVLRDLCKLQNIESRVKDELAKQVRPEKLSDFREIINKAENFFKHADRDPTDILEFNPESTEWILWDCIYMYESISGENYPLISVYKIWFYFNHTNILLESNYKEYILKTQEEFQINPKDKKIFWDILPRLSQIK